MVKFQEFKSFRVAFDEVNPELTAVMTGIFGVDAMVVATVAPVNVPTVVLESREPMSEEGIDKLFGLAPEYKRLPTDTTSSNGKYIMLPDAVSSALIKELLGHFLGVDEMQVRIEGYNVLCVAAPEVKEVS